MGSPWWRDAVFYEIYVRSFADSDGDGVGDLAGITRRLGYVADLGVDAIWLTPFYPSPMADHGYDVADPRNVDPLFGDLAAFDALLAEAHRLGLRVVVDVVPNHSSHRHPWFQAALRSPVGSLERARYHFRDGCGPAGTTPPNNWVSVFGGIAWTRVTEPDGTPGQWYLHLFAPEQPDLNWDDPDVGDDYEQTLRFWLDRGVDGFRIDVAHGLAKAHGLPSNPPGAGRDLFEVGSAAGDRPAPVQHNWDQPRVHEIYRRWRGVLDEYPGERMAVGEVWVKDPVALSRYVRPDELHQSFNIPMLLTPWSASAFQTLVTQAVAALEQVDAPATWVLSNHDVVRTVTRFGGGEEGVRRARAAVLLMLALPGSVYLYQGEELGLPEVDLPDEVLQDPVWERSGHTARGRDGCRVPMPWAGGAPPYHFSASSTGTWLPQPADWADVTAAAQTGDPGSVLELYRRALRVRRDTADLGAGSLKWLDLGPDVLAFCRQAGTICVVNFGAEQVDLPDGEVLLASGPGQPGGRDSAVWLRGR